MKSIRSSGPKAANQAQRGQPGKEAAPSERRIDKGCGPQPRVEEGALRVSGHFRPSTNSGSGLTFTFTWLDS